MYQGHKNTLSFSRKEGEKHVYEVAPAVKKEVRNNVLDFKAIHESICSLSIKTKLWLQNTCMLPLHCLTGIKSSSYGCQGTLAFLAMKKLTNLLEKEQLCHYSAKSQLLEYPGVQQEKRLEVEMSVNAVLPGKIYQLTDTANFLLVYHVRKELKTCLN
jgi:hypothetical protein